MSHVPAGPRHPALAAGIVGAAFVLAYAPVLRKLVHDWSTNENYSHGFLIVPLAAYLAWERRARLAAVPMRPAPSGLLVVLLGLAALAAGTLGVELFVARTSMLVVLAGSVLFIGGWQHLRILLFPIAFLLLMIPLPAIVFNQIAFPLQLIASQFGEASLRLLDIPVLREGNLIRLASATLQVAEACSGIRSLVSLLTLSIVYSYFTEPRPPVRVLMVVATVPIAIATNGLRVASLGVAAHYYGAGAVEGTFHDVSGWLVFVMAFALMLLLHTGVRSLTRAYRPHHGPSPVLSN